MLLLPESKETRRIGRVRCATASEFFAVSTNELGRPPDMLFQEEIGSISLPVLYMAILFPSYGRLDIERSSYL
jgi:hypothetical protein